MTKFPSAPYYSAKPVSKLASVRIVSRSIRFEVSNGTGNGHNLFELEPRKENNSDVAALF